MDSKILDSLDKKKDNSSSISVVPTLDKLDTTSSITPIQAGQFYNPSEQYGNSGVGNSKYDTGITPGNISNLEEIRAENQGGFARFGNMLTRIGSHTGSYIGQGFSELAGVPVALLGGSIEAITSNPGVKFFDNFKTATDEAFPDYETLKSKNSNIFEKMIGLDGGHWWRTEGADRFALALGALAPGVAESEGLGVANLVGKALESTGSTKFEGVADAFELQKSWTKTQLGKDLMDVPKSAELLAKRLTGTAQLATGTITQAALSAFQTEQAVRQDLKYKQENGVLNPETGNPYNDNEIEQKVSQARQSTFYESLPSSLLLSSVTLPSIFSSFNGSKAAVSDVLDPLTKEFKPIEAMSKKLAIAKTIGLSTWKGVEGGPIAENLQVAISKVNEDYAEGKTKSANGEDILKAYLDDFSDPNNGQNNIGLGFIQGLVESAVFGHNSILKIAKGIDEGSKEYKSKLDLKDYLNSTKLNFQTNDGRTYNVKNSDGSDKINPITNKPIPDNTLKSNTILGLYGRINSADLQTISELTDNKFEKNLYSNNSLSGLVYSLAGTKGGMDYVNNLLELETKKQKELLKPNDINSITGEEITSEQILSNRKLDAQKLFKEYNLVQNTKIDLKNIEGISEEDKLHAYSFIDEQRRGLYAAKSTQLLIEKQKQENNQEILNLKTNVSKDVNYYNQKVDELEKNNKNLDNLDSFYTDIQNEILNPKKIDDRFKKYKKTYSKENVTGKLAETKTTEVPKTKISTDNNLRTFDFGNKEGTAQTEEANKQIHDKIVNHPDEKMAGDGETFNEAVNRVVPTIKDLVENAKDGTVVTTHNSVYGLISLWDKQGRPDVFNEDLRKQYVNQDNKFGTGSSFKIKTKNGEITIIRHGETTDNAKKVFRTSGAELTQKGIDEAKQVGKELSNTDIPQIVSSPLKRAIHTSQLILGEQGNKQTQSDLNDELDLVQVGYEESGNIVLAHEEIDETESPKPEEQLDNKDSVQLFPNTKTVIDGKVIPNPTRETLTQVSNGEVMSSKEVQDLIDSGVDINSKITIDVKDFQGKKSIQIKIGNKILGFLQNREFYKNNIKQLIDRLKIGDKLSNKEVKELGFNILVSNGYINTTTENPLHLNELDKLIQTKIEGIDKYGYIIFDRGSRKYIEEGNEPFLITETIESGEEGSTLPQNIRQLGRYILSFKDSSGNYKYIPLNPSKLTDYNKYLNSLRELSAKIVKGDENGKLTSSQISELWSKIPDVFIAQEKGVNLTIDFFVYDDGKLSVKLLEQGEKGQKDKVVKEVKIAPNELVALTTNGALLSYINELIGDKFGTNINENSFRESVPTGTYLEKNQADKLFQAYVTPQVLHGQDVVISMNKPKVDNNIISTEEEEFTSNVEASDNPLGVPLIKSETKAEERARKAKERPDVSINGGIEITSFKMIDSDERKLIENNRKEELEKIVTNIFPNTKIKHIVYHGVLGGKENYENILKNGFSFNNKSNWSKDLYAKSIFFSDELTALGYGSEIIENPLQKDTNAKDYLFYNRNIINAILNIETLEKPSYGVVTEKANILKEKNKNIKNYGIEAEEGGEGEHINYIVFEPSQIHILTQEELNKTNEINIKYNKKLKDLEEGSVFKLADKTIDKLIDSHEISETKRITYSDISVETREDLRRVIGNIPNSKTPWGAFRQNVIYIWNKAGSGTGYHEAFHAIFRMAISDKDVNRYLKLAEREITSKYKNQSALYKALDELRASHISYANLSEQQMYELLLEEHMADRFADWKKNADTVKTSTGLKQLFKRLWNVVKHLFKINDNLELFFDKINRGAFSNTKSTPNRLTFVNDTTFKNLNTGANTFMSTVRSKQIINTFAALVKQEAKKNIDEETHKEARHSVNPRNSDILDRLIAERVETLNKYGFDYVDGLTDRVKADKLEQRIEDELFALDNKNAKKILIEQVLNKLEIFDNKQEEIDEENELREEGDNSSERQGSQEAWTISLENSTANVIKEYIEFAMYNAIDELTNQPVKLSVDAKTIYNGLGHTLSNTEESQMIGKFITYALDNAQAKAVLDMIISDTELGIDYEKGELIGNAKKNLNDLRKIIVAFKNSKVDFITTTFKPEYKEGVLVSNSVKVFNANLNRAEKLSMKDWASNLHSLKEENKTDDKYFSTRISTINKLFKNKGFEEVYNTKDLTNRIKELQKEFSEIGMSLSTGYLRFSILSNYSKQGFPLSEGQTSYLSNFSDVIPLDIDTITAPGEYTLKGFLDSGKDPYDRSEGNQSIASKLEKIALANSEFDESIGSANFKGSDGNTRYDIIKGSYVLDESRKLRNKQYRDELVKKYPILKDNSLLNDDKFLNNLTVNLIDGVRDINFSTNEGQVFGDFTEREYLLQHLGYWFAQDAKGVHTLFRQNESSNTAYDVVMSVNSFVNDNGSISDNAINKIYNNFKAEFDRIRRETVKGFGDVEGYNNTLEGRAFRFTEFSNLVYLLGPNKYFQIENVAKTEGQLLSDELVNDVKKSIKTSLNSQIKQFKEILHQNDIIHLNGTEIGENRLLPTILNKQVLNTNDLNKTLSNFYLNDYINSFALNQLFDGDYALSRDDKGLVDVKLNNEGKFDENGTVYRLPKQDITIDIVKRNKGAMGSGTDMGTGVHIVAFIKDINVFVNGSKDGQLLRSDKGDKINSNDAQSYTNINHIMFMSRRLGRESSAVKSILRKIRRGIEINSEEQTILEHAQASLNPWKTVTFGREFYIKTSEAVITRHMVSNITDKEAFNKIMDRLEAAEDKQELTKEQYKEFNKELLNLYIPVKGMEQYHRILNQMDIHGIDQVVTESASKGMTIAPQDSLSEDLDLSISSIEIPNSYKRLQVETPTGKKIITAGTQLMQLIDSEQVDSTPYNLNGKDTTIGQIRKEYRSLMSKTRDNSFKMADSYIRNSNNGQDISALRDKFIKTLQSTGADEQLLEIFKLNWNLLPAIDKAEQLFLAHFGSGILAQKVPGTKVSLMSDAHWNLVVDENNIPVLNKLVKANPEKYTNNTTRKLLHNVRDPKTGQMYSECVLSERVFSKFGLKIGDEIPVELAEMLGTRIPTQDKHSMISLRVVDVMPNYLEGTGIFPSEVVLLSGADFDIDSMFIQQPAFYMNKGKAIKFGSETTKEDKWNAFKEYLKDDKLFQIELKNRRQVSDIYQSIIKIHPKGVEEKGIIGRTEEQKKLLSQEIDSIYKQTLTFFDLPTNVDELGDKELNNNSLNNQILERQRAMLTNKAMEEIALTPVDVEPMRNVAIEIAKLKGTANEINNSSSSLLGKIKSNFQNSAGKEGIGPVANALQAFTFLAKNKIKRTSKNILKINGKELNEFKYLNSIGGRIADTLSTILSVMTDNAKDPIAGKIGLSLELLSPYNYLISLGVSLKDASLIINTPSIQMYGKLLKENKYKIQSESEKKGTRQEKLSELFKEILGIKGTELDSKYKIQADLERFKDATIETAQVEGLIIDGLTPNNAQDNIRILVKFLQIEEEAKYFQDLNNLIKLTKGLPTSFLDANKNLKDSIDNLGLQKVFEHPQIVDFKAPFDVSEAVENDDLLKGNVKNALTILNQSSSIFISETQSFQNQFNKHLLNLKDNLTKDQIKELKRSFLGFISTRAYIKYMETKVADFNPVRPELLFPQLKGKTLGQIVSDLKNSKDDNIKNNSFVKWLKVELGVNTEKNIDNSHKGITFDRVSGKSWIKLSEESINDIVNSYDELERNPDTKEAAHAAFFYLLTKDNFEYRNDSFVKYLAPRVFSNVSEGINNELQQLTQGILNDNFNQWSDDFRINIASQYSTQNVIKTFKPNQIKEFNEKTTQLNFNEETSQGLFTIKETSEGSKFIYPEFIKVKDKLFHYPLKGEDNNIGLSAIYKEIPSFGYNTISVLPLEYQDNLELYSKLGQIKNEDKEGVSKEQEKVNLLISGVTEDVESMVNEYEGVGFDNSLDGDNPLGIKNKEEFEIFQGRKTKDFDNREFNYYTLSKEEAKTYGEFIDNKVIKLDNYLIRTNEELYNKEIDEFKAKTGKTFDILDNSKEGLQIQEEFFKFLKSKNYKGFSIYSKEEINDVLKNLKEYDNKYVIPFEETKQNPLSQFDGISEIDDISDEEVDQRIKDCK